MTNITPFDKPAIDFSRDDLPTELLEQLRKEQSNELTKWIIDILKVKNPASVDDIIIGLYRTQNYAIKSRGSLASKLSKMVDDNLIKRGDIKGYYTFK